MCTHMGVSGGVATSASSVVSLSCLARLGEEAEICVKGACVTRGYVTWQVPICPKHGQRSGCEGSTTLFVGILVGRRLYALYASIFGAFAVEEMRAHMDQDPNVEAFTPDGWLRTGDKGRFMVCAGPQ